jgi:succinate dehydrogenase flavin-adding protein (antitoxin of CptAB toxin-antitoxin module)
MLELDLIIGHWARKNIPSLSYQECLDFQTEILQAETPVLVKYLTMEVPIPSMNNHYLLKLLEFAKSSKSFTEEE